MAKSKNKRKKTKKPGMKKAKSASKSKGKKKAASKPKKKRAAAKKKSSARKRPKKGFKLSAATKKKIGAKSRAHWKSITGKGRPGKGNHIPLAQLKKNHARLGRTIAVREKSPAAWA